MTSSLWDDIKKTIKDGVNYAAEKTEEYTKIGKIKVEIMNLRRSLEKVFTELGQETFELLDQGKKVDPAKNEEIGSLLDRVHEIRKKVEAKEKEMKAVKLEAEKKGEKSAEPKPSGKPSEKTAGKKGDAKSE